VSTRTASRAGQGRGRGALATPVPGGGDRDRRDHDRGIGGGHDQLRERDHPGGDEAHGELPVAVGDGEGGVDAPGGEGEQRGVP